MEPILMLSILDTHYKQMLDAPVPDGVSDEQSYDLGWQSAIGEARRMVKTLTGIVEDPTGTEPRKGAGLHVGRNGGGAA